MYVANCYYDNINMYVNYLAFFKQKIIIEF